MLCIPRATKFIHVPVLPEGMKERNTNWKNYFMRNTCFQLQVINPNNFPPLLHYLNIHGTMTGPTSRLCNIFNNYASTILISNFSCYLNTHANMTGTMPSIPYIHKHDVHFPFKNLVFNTHVFIQKFDVHTCKAAVTNHRFHTHSFSNPFNFNL